MVRWILAGCFIFAFTMGTSFIVLPFFLTVVGLWPALVAIVVSWAYFLLTGFYYLEATLAMPPGSNAFSISNKYFGKGGAQFVSIIFALVTFANLSSYFFLAAHIFSALLQSLHIYLSPTSMAVIVVCLAGISVYLGITFTMIFNFLLIVLTAVIFYFSFQGLSSTVTGEASFPPHTQWLLLILAIPSFLNTIYYQTLIPTIADFLNYNKARIQSCIAVFFSACIVLFIAWLFFLFNSSGKGYRASLSQLNPNALTYENLVKIPVIGKWLPYLIGVSLITSILCNLSVLVDFIADLSHTPPQERKGIKRLLFCLYALLPSFLFGLIQSVILFIILVYITEIGGMFLAGLLPILWIWSLRYLHEEKVALLVPGGKGLLLLLTIFTVFVFYCLGFFEIFYKQTA
jgi:tyrosine-specific transport protein